MRAQVGLFGLGTNSDKGLIRQAISLGVGVSGIADYRNREVAIFEVMHRRNSEP